jgi:hypothetical protein
MHNDETILPGLVLVSDKFQNRQNPGNIREKSVKVSVLKHQYKERVISCHLSRQRFDEDPCGSESTIKYCPTLKELRTEQETLPNLTRHGISKLSILLLVS